MGLSTAEEALLALAADDRNRSKIGRLRGIYAVIEETQRAGVSNSKIVETLNAQGFDLSLKTFETMLYRIRKERTQQPPVSASRPLAQAGRTEAVNPVEAVAESAISAGEDLSGLSAKQRRELVADKYITSETTNPLLKRLIKENNKT
jgi:hypothetical protein